MTQLRKLLVKERTGQRGKELTCPHCGKVWLAGHLIWSAVVCMGCKRDVAKCDWLCAKD